jgi:hypothetical protein
MARDFCLDPSHGCIILAAIMIYLSTGRQFGFAFSD